MGADIKAIRARIKSVDSTRHITKAMQLVAASKIKRASNKMEASRFYRQVMLDAFSDLAVEKSSYSAQRDRNLPVLYIIIAGDRGLAGGYNSNVMKLVERHIAQQNGAEICTVPVGKKAMEYCKRRNMEVLTEAYTIAEDTSIGNCHTAAHFLAHEFVKGSFDKLYIVYTNFASMLTQHATVMQVLPVPYEKSEAKNESGAMTLYEPGPESVFNAIVPEYIAGIFYGALCQSYASEQAARRTAMDSASKNADDMIEDLSLKYNRARQGAITQEITEIVAGAEGE